MGEKEGKGEKEKKAGDGGEKKKEEGSPTVILKVDMHCEGCASKIKRSVRRFEGVEGVTADMASNKLTVRGKVDPGMLRDHVETKIRKKVEIVSAVNPPKKEAEAGGQKADAGGKKAAAGGDSKEQKKSVEPAASTVVLQIRLHCDGCIQRIKKTIFKIKGVKEVTVDAQKDLVTVKGTMDVNSLPSYLKDKLKRSVEIVPAKASAGGGGGGGGGEKKDKAEGEKTKGKEDAGGGEKKAEGGGGGEKKAKEGGGGGEKQGEGAGGEKKKEKEGGGQKEESVKATAAASMAAPAAWETHRTADYGSYGYMVENLEMPHAPQLFSDENPNACSVM